MSEQAPRRIHERGGIDASVEGTEYFEKRQLAGGVAGWLLLAGLGVAYVISGDFAGWNFGMGEGGWGGMLIATGLMGTMYLFMVLGLAELSSTISTTGGGYAFARRAMGPWGGFLTGTAILIEYAIAPAAIANFIGAYVESLTGFDVGWVVFLVFYAVFIGLHLWGVGEALKLMFVITAIAVVALFVFVIAALPKFDASNLNSIPVDTSAFGSSSFLPFGLVGIWAALPYAIWFYLAVEGVPLAAEESKDPAKDMPRGIIAAIVTLLVFAFVILLVAPGAAGSDFLKDSGNPLVEALEAPGAYGGQNLVSQFINLVGLLGLIASFFSIIFAYSRQTFALSRAGYLPKFLSLTGQRKTPYVALIVPGIIGFVMAVLNQGDLLILVAVFGATISYVMMTLSHIILRFKEPELDRPYRTPGGVVTTGIACVLGVVALIAGFLVDTRVVAITAGVYVIAIAYFGLYSRHHIVASAPEEEFALIESSESELH
ncbi:MULTISPECIES: ethanolamine permease [unclassified Nocardioides]|uniref:ethanolamine permease n=1 Tax=unclassified Nocardioides TaxID=2615069 RepID=UPI000057017F|nr:MULTISPECIES: ethanolamine permease [unclassified Nocardioides]ABL83534.1 ethanolamine:proton symporter, EAT family [Nocardioides sp. JS614]